MAAFGMPAADIEPWTTDRLLAMLEAHWVPAQQVLFREGEQPEWLYFMRDGEIRLTKEGAPSWILRGRWVVGALEALGDAPRPRTATAVTDVDAMRAPVAGWLDLLEDSAKLARGAVLRAGEATASLEDQVPAMPWRGSATWGPGLVPERPLALVERLALLADVRILSGAGVQSVVDLAAACTERWYEPGETVLARGVDRTELCLVVQGEVDAARAAPEVLRRYGPGDIVCGAASFGAPARAWEAKAWTKARILAFPVVTWFDLMEEHFDVVRSTLGALGARREALLEHIASSRDEVLILT
jgi:CRP-like cAMP-binding protein